MRVLIAVCALALAAGAQVYQSKEQKLPRQVAPQPVPFSHKLHAATPCAQCHSTTTRGDRAGLPQASGCMLCHRAVKRESPEIRKLAALAKSGERLRWVRVYRVPEYVFFSHAKHVSAGLECRACHGPVAERDVLAQEVSTSMTACMNCHAARGVSNECSFCHTLSY
jgi:hypothetical protein